MGEIIEEDIGIKGLHLGFNGSVPNNCITHSARSKRWVMTQSALPLFFKSKVNHKPTDFMKVIFKLRGKFRLYYKLCIVIPF